MYERIIRTLKEKDVEIIENASLRAINSMRLPSFSRLLLIPRSLEAFLFCLTYLRNEGVKFDVIGGMTNTLIKDDLYDGVLIKTSKLNKKENSEGLFTLECGTATASLIARGLELGYGGYEGLRGIPGTVGGAVYGNAGAFGSSIGDCFVKGEFFDVSSGGVFELSRSDMLFSYRYSLMKNKPLILLRASFLLKPVSVDTSLALVDSFLEERRMKQPTQSYSLGSTFKRYNGVGAGYYIDGAGLKGYLVGDAVVSTKHAGFIVNRGRATSADVLSLIEIIRERVFDVYGVLLEPEIQIL